jgi:hypothetical protein
MTEIVIDFKLEKQKIEEIVPQNLTQWLKKSVSVIQKDTPFDAYSSDMSIADIGKLKKKIEARVTKEIMDQQLIDTETFLCGLYVSNLLGKMVTELPESWFLIDYVEKFNDFGNPYILKEAGDMCFLLCGAFCGKEKIPYYQNSGAVLYKNFYEYTKIEIGLLMSQHFDSMTQVASRCFTKFGS